MRRAWEGDQKCVGHGIAEDFGALTYVRVATPTANDEGGNFDRRVGWQWRVQPQARTPIENVGCGRCHDIVAYAGGKGIEATRTVMQVDHVSSRFLVATLKGSEVGITERGDLLVEFRVLGQGEEIRCGRLDDAEAHQRGAPAQGKGETRLAAKRMANEVYRPAGPPDDSLDDLRLVRDRGVSRRPALGRAAIPEQACRDDAEAAVQRRNHSAPGG